ncbi:hypothetical protein LNTAR_23174 [Lentisphaera araneosa HTCC2155]|uniref:Uncharacterized protein n=1 Tax=Lentisphaera araneosa HTCC2155 TaxID=313628 RepID=A6DGM6_9BACT|nr:hypothetical protein [Lentisphaera araneosa]EDM29343.1 hypothetical protein LNTAR_23174 [Lentisphaera araneosa HTCC2155]
MKRESAEECLNFFDVPQDPTRRTRKGIYGSPIFGTEGKRVQVILLDRGYYNIDSPAQE